MGTLLDVRSVSMNFGGLAALKQVDFRVREGEIVGLIGPNGAGKTTMFNCLSGFLTPTSGEVLFRETSVVRLAPHQITALGMTRTFQTSRVFKRMTVMDHMLGEPTCISGPASGPECSGPAGSAVRRATPGRAA
jgi:branched-chain amino acid transport system ATP-binding protein